MNLKNGISFSADFVTKFLAERQLEKPIEKEIFEALPHKKNIAKKFKKDTAKVISAIGESDAEQLEKQFTEANEIELDGFNVTKDMIQFKKSTKKFFTER